MFSLILTIAWGIGAAGPDAGPVGPGGLPTAQQLHA